jgi:hypothetical protein
VDGVERASPKTGGLGIKEAMSARGMEAEVPLLKRIRYIAEPLGLE